RTATIGPRATPILGNGRPLTFVAPMKLVVTVPAQNEERTIGRVVREVPRTIPGVESVEVVVMDDESTDATAAEARDAGAHVVEVHGRRGLGKVFQAGIEAAMRRGADLVVNIDGDGQFDSADIAKLVQPLLEDKADFVTCTRFKNPDDRPEMPGIKYFGNWAVVKIVNFACGGGGRFTDVSCGFRGFNREALYRLTLFGRYTYTQECFIDLFSKNLRIIEVPLKVRGTREFGESRVASSVWKYAANTGPIIIRAMRDIRPLKFFGVIAGLLALPGFAMLGVVTANYLIFNPGKTQPFTSLISIGGGLLTLSVIVGVMALLADMMARHRRITEELLYLARRRIYGTGDVRMPVTQPRIARLITPANGHENGNGHGRAVARHATRKPAVFRDASESKVPAGSGVE
ncbi:MAG: glycosyltransferase family 2 protein, partial [Planctomycetota bacterium]